MVVCFFLRFCFTPILSQLNALSVAETREYSRASNVLLSSAFTFSHRSYLAEFEALVHLLKVHLLSSASWYLDLDLDLDHLDVHVLIVIVWFEVDLLKFHLLSAACGLILIFVSGLDYLDFEGSALDRNVWFQAMS